MQDKQTVHQLNNDYVQRLRASEVAHQAQKLALSKQRRVRAIRILIGFAVALVLCVWAYGRNLASLHQINQQTTVAQKQLSSAKAEHGQLNQRVKQLHNDDYLTQLIRSKYLYSKDGEIVYNLPSNSK